MSLLTKQQIADILWMSWDHGHFEWKGFKWDLMRWNKKQTAQFEIDWSEAPRGAEEAVLELHWLDRNGDKFAWDMARTRLSNESTTPAASEPVAWIYQSTGFRGHQVLIKEKQDMGAELWVESPLYLAPPKREPSMTGREMYQRGYAAAERDLKRETLSEGELNSLYYRATNQTLREQDTRLAFGFARAIEKAHGIGIDDEHDDA